jgi:hypothetical protein
MGTAADLPDVGSGTTRDESARMYKPRSTATAGLVAGVFAVE